MARKPSDIVAVKVRMREELRRKIERLAAKSNHTVNTETVRLLENAVLAELAGVSGLENVIRAVQSSSAAFAVQEVMKQYGIEPAADGKPQITKSSE